MDKEINPSQVEAVMTAFRETFTSAEKAKHAAVIIHHLKLKGAGDISGKKFQAIVGYIRKNDLMFPDFIVSGVQTGYWLTNVPDEEETFLQQQLNRMSNQFLNVEKLYKRRQKKAAAAGMVQASIFNY